MKYTQSLPKMEGEKLMSEKLSFKWENGKMRVKKFECENQKEEV